MMNDAIRFVEFGEVTFDLLGHRAYAVLFGEVAFLTPRCTCVFGLDEKLEVSVYDEGYPYAFAEFAEEVFTQVPGSGIMKSLPQLSTPRQDF